MSITNDEIQTLLHLAHAYLERGQHTEARSMFSGLTAVPGSGAYPCMGLGALAHEENDLNQAIQYFDHATKLEPQNLEARVELAKLLLKTGLEAEARSALAPVAERIGPGQAHAWMLRQRLRI